MIRSSNVLKSRGLFSNIEKGNPSQYETKPKNHVRTGVKHSTWVWCYVVSVLTFNKG